MSNNLIAITPSAYDYPLLIKHLLHAPLSRSPGQVIVYREHRHTYRQFRDRLGSLASALTDFASRPATSLRFWTGTPTATMNATSRSQ